MNTRAARLLTRRVRVFERRAQITDQVADEGRHHLTAAETATFEQLTGQLTILDRAIAAHRRR